MLGAGRTVAGQRVDAQAGVVFDKQVGDVVEQGDIIVKIFTNVSQTAADQAIEAIQKAAIVAHNPPPTPKGSIITHCVTQQDGTQPFVGPSFLK